MMPIPAATVAALMVLHTVGSASMRKARHHPKQHLSATCSLEFLAADIGKVTLPVHEFD